jgi:hypothetical protein
MISTSFILSTGLKKWMPMNFCRLGAGGGQAADRQGGGVAGEEAARRQHRLGLLRHFGLELAVFEHGLDDQVAALQVGGAGGGGDAAQQLGLVVRAHAALVHARLGEFGAVGLAVLGLFQAHVLQHRGDAPAGLRVGDARAHHAGAQDADLLRLVARHVLRAALARS